MSIDYKKLLQRLKTFIRREYMVQREQLGKQWSLPLTQRIQQGYAIEGLSVRSRKGEALKMDCRCFHRAAHEG